MTRLRCAILDDYMNLTLRMADWSKVGDRVDITVFDQPFGSAEAAAGALADFEIVCAMREHKIPGSRTAVWRFFQRHKITVKKKPARGRAGARGRGAGTPTLDARTGPVRSGPAGVHR